MYAKQKMQLKRNLHGYPTPLQSRTKKNVRCRSPVHRVSSFALRKVLWDRPGGGGSSDQASVEECYDLYALREEM